MENENLSDTFLQIGFAEECQSWKLESRFFPSKIGGKPSWLHLSSLPTNEEMCCEKCQQQCILLCQIYAPIDNCASCFHRSIFVFFCRNEECSEDNDHRNFKVFRCQLPRSNEFYPYEPPIEEKDWRTDIKAEKYSSLCYVCGNASLNKCSRCQVLFYCSKEHQKMDWKNGHKTECSANLTCDNVKSRSIDILIKEFEILIETEDVDEVVQPVVNEEELMKEYEKLVLEGKAGTLQGQESVDEDLSAMALKEDITYNNFKKKIRSNPDQILRYERNGKPLWVSQSNVPNDADIPVCQYCQGKRHFEFQILPQMLNYLQFDDIGKSIDWGTLAIYTCSKSCDQGPAYKKEYLWKQDFSAENSCV